jgi:hypothetical protein
MAEDDWDWLTDLLRKDSPPEIVESGPEESSVDSALGVDDPNVVSIFRRAHRQNPIRTASSPLREATHS